MTVLTEEMALRMFAYDDETGQLTRKIDAGGPHRAGSKVGTVGSQGYVVLKFRRRTYAAHRIAWLVKTGAWPKGSIDHINGDKADNRWANLRDVDHSTNLENLRKPRSDNRLGVMGVQAYGKRFAASIWVKGRPIRLGVFETVSEAGDAYIEAKRRFHAGCTL